MEIAPGSEPGKSLSPSGEEDEDVSVGPNAGRVNGVEAVGDDNLHDVDSSRFEVKRSGAVEQCADGKAVEPDLQETS